MSAINTGATPASHESGSTDSVPNAFALAAQISALLQGVSKKDTKQALEMVATLNGLRVISADRPIGQATAGRQQPANKPKSAPRKKGEAPPPAAWKQTAAYRQLQADRTAVVDRLKAALKGSSEQLSLQEDLRCVEQKLKDLRASKAGD